MQTSPSVTSEQSSWSNLGYGIIGLFVIGLLFTFFKACSMWAFDLDDNFKLNPISSVHRCLTAIEDRNWENYVATFEPSAVLHPTSPGLSVHFLNPQASVVQKGDQTSVVQLRATVKVDGTDWQWPIDIQLNMVKVNRPSFVGSLGLKKWYIAARDVSKLPFNFSY